MRCRVLRLTRILVLALLLEKYTVLQSCRSIHEKWEPVEREMCCASLVAGGQWREKVLLAQHWSCCERRREPIIVNVVGGGSIAVMAEAVIVAVYLLKLVDRVGRRVGRG